MRSKLFVPGSRPELFAKALASEADGISIDLEDAVVEARKAEARMHVRDWLLSRPALQGKLIIVRINGIDTPHFDEDIDAVVREGLDVVNLPKPFGVEEVRAASAAIARAEAANGVTKPVRLLLNIETPQALREAAALAVADPRVMGLQVGLGDLFENMGVFRREFAAIQHVLMNVRMAAAEAGIEAWDGAYANTKDTAGFIEEAQLARRLGFAGKSCIHPSQVALANEAFRPSDAEIAHSLRVVEAAALPEHQAMGAFLVDGRMVDKPFILRAEKIVATARRLGLAP